MADDSVPVKADRDAVIFLPALGTEWTDQSVEKMGRRIAVALERSAPAQAKFAAKVAPGTQGYGDGLKATMATITRTDGNTEQPILDLYGFEYHRDLTKRFLDRNLFTKALRLVVMIVYSTGRLVASVVQPRRATGRSAAGEAEPGSDGKHAKRPREVFQLLLGALGLLLFCVYAGIVIYALVDTVIHINAFKKGKAGASLAEAAVVVATAVGMSLPKIREWITKAAVDFLSATAYLGFGSQRELVAGKLEALLEHVAERGSPAYARIHVISYSFGSVVAMDTLFPRGRPAPQRASEVRTLITIGSPFDMVRTYWRDYFDQRSCPPGDRRWINVYSPEDVLGSNFRNDDKAERPTQGIMGTSASRCAQPDQNISYNPTGAEKVSIVGLFLLAGLRAHTIYWDEDADAETCLTQIVSDLYAGSPVLA